MDQKETHDLQRQDGHPDVSTARHSADIAAAPCSTSIEQDANDNTSTASDPQEPPVELPPVDGGAGAWRFLFGCSIVEFLVYGLSTAYGSFQDYHLSNPTSPLHSASPATVAAPGTLITAGNLIAPWAFLGLYRIFPAHCPRVAWVALAVSCIGLVIASVVGTSVAGVIICQGFIFGFAAGVFWTPTMLWLPQWFDRRRGLAIGLMFVGSAAGGVVWPFVCSALLDHLGFGWTLRILALIQGVLGTLAVILMRPRIHPSRTASDYKPLAKLKLLLPLHDRFVFTWQGVINVVILILQSAAFWPVLYYLSIYGRSLGLSNAKSSSLLAFVNGFSGFSYTGLGRLSDSLPHQILSIACALTGALFVGCLYGLAKSFAPLIVFGILIGTTNGGYAAVIPRMAQNGHDPAVTSLEFFALRGIGSIVGPIIASALYEDDASAQSSSPWSADSVFGSHGLGPVLIFSMSLFAVQACLALWDFWRSPHRLADIVRRQKGRRVESVIDDDKT